MTRDMHLRAALRLAAALAAGALACVAAFGFAPTPASAQEAAFADATAAEEAAGYATVLGVGGLDEDAAFSSLSELCSALAGWDLPETYVVCVSGALPAGEPCELPCAVGGCVQVVGVEGTDATVTGAADVWCPGSLELRGLAFDEPLAAGAAGSLLVTGCSLPGGLWCQDEGGVTVSGCTFAASEGTAAAADAACSVTLAAAGAGASFDGNVVTGFAGGVRVTQAVAEAAGHVSACGNSFELAPAPDGSARYELALAGGPWAGAQVSFDGNEARATDALVLLGEDFSLASDADAAPASLASGTLGADAARVFEVASRGTGVCSRTAAGIVAAGSPGSSAQAQAASDAAFPQAAAVSGVTCTVSYDANGAVAGEAPEPATAQPGERVTLATCSSLVKPGSEFRGWNTQPDGSGTFYAAGQVVTLAQSITLYAQWSEVGTVATVDVASAQGAAS